MNQPDSPSESELPTQNRSHRVWFLLLSAAIVMACAFWGYQLSFSVYQTYDDEGYVMMSLHQIIHGRPLYDETYSQYGPAFFQLQSLFHATTQLPVTHDVVRWKTLFQWLLIAGFTSLAVYRVTRSRALLLAAFGFVFLHLDRLTQEPGHPQEWCALSVAVILFLSTFVKRIQVKTTDDALTGAKTGHRDWLFALIGALTALVILTKINVGLLLLSPLACAMLITSPRTRFWNYLSVAGVGIALAMPAMLVFKHAFHPVSTAMPQIVIIASVSMLLTGLKRTSSESFNAKRLLLAIVALFATMVMVFAIALARGTTPGGLLEGMILQHSRFTDLFFLPPPLSRLAVPVTIAGLFLCLFALKGSQRSVDIARVVLLTVLCVSGVTYLLESLSTTSNGLINRGMAGGLCSFAPAMVWVLLWPARRGGASRTARVVQSRFARAAICFTAVFQPLISYPLPGTQMAVGSFILLAAGLIAVWDLMEEPPAFAIFQSGKSLRWVPISCLLILAVASLLVRDVYSYQRRESFISLDLPGTHRLRLSQKQHNEIHELVDSLKAESDTFIFAENTRNSYYFWTNRMPPTGYNGTVWPYMLSHDLQQRTMEALSHYRRVVVVRDACEFPLPDDSPLLHYIDDNFQISREISPFEVWTVKRRG